MKILVTGGSGFIGTNLVELLLKNRHEVQNIDIKAPPIDSYKKYWLICDILDKDKLKNICVSFKPEIIIHLAARADVEGKTLEDYNVNTEGTSHLLEIIRSLSYVKRVVITSTQFVNQYKGKPKHDEDYSPHTVYGESKVITEQLTRKANLSCCWTLVRPTNIWGPWHWRYPHEFWKVIADHKYFHPGKSNVIRSYGYVGNVAWQINRIIEVPINLVNRQVFYLGDEPINLIDWVNGFSLKQVGKKVRIVPPYLIKLAAMAGDILKLINITFPITSSRYLSMTTSNSAPMEKTFNTLGIPPYSLNEGIEETIKWMKLYHPELVENR